MGEEPVTGHDRHLAQGIALGEQMTRTLDDVEFVLTRHLGRRTAIQVEHHLVVLDPPDHRGRGGPQPIRQVEERTSRLRIVALERGGLEKLSRLASDEAAPG